MPRKIGLILGPGALYGAYGAGVANVLGQHIDFHRVYGCSVGAFTGTFLVTQQFNIMLNVWRNYVHGKLLVNLKNPLRIRHILDLEFLISLFETEGFCLDLKKVSREKGRLVYVLTHYLSGEPHYFCPDKNNVFKGMIASSAVPHVYPKVEIDGEYFYDGALSDPYPLKRALDEGNDKVIVVSNFSPDRGNGPLVRLSRSVAKAVEKSEEGMRFVEDRIRVSSDIFLIRPTDQILRSILDTDKSRINATLDMGITDAQIFMKNFSLAATKP